MRNAGSHGSWPASLPEGAGTGTVLALDARVRWSPSIAFNTNEGTRVGSPAPARPEAREGEIHHGHPGPGHDISGTAHASLSAGRAYGSRWRVDSPVPVRTERA